MSAFEFCEVDGSFHDRHQRQENKDHYDGLLPPPSRRWIRMVKRLPNIITIDEAVDMLIGSGYESLTKEELRLNLRDSAPWSKFGIKEGGRWKVKKVELLADSFFDMKAIDDERLTPGFSLDDYAPEKWGDGIRYAASRRLRVGLNNMYQTREKVDEMQEEHEGLEPDEIVVGMDASDDDNLYGDDSKAALEDADDRVREAFSDIVSQPYVQSQSGSRKDRFNAFIDSIPDARVSKIISDIRYSRKKLEDIASENGVDPATVGAIYKRAVDGLYGHIDSADGIESCVAGRKSDGVYLQPSGDSSGYGYIGHMMSNGEPVKKMYYGNLGTARGNWLKWCERLRGCDDVDDSGSMFLVMLNGGCNKVFGLYNSRKNANEKAESMNETLAFVSSDKEFGVHEVPIMD